MSLVDRRAGRNRDAGVTLLVRCSADGGERPSVRLRLAGRRVRLRRQRLGAAAGREGLRSACSSAAAVPGPGLPALDVELRRYIWAPRARAARDLPANDLQGRHRSFAARRRRRHARLREHAVRPAHAFFAGGAWAGLADWESELEPHYARRERMLGVVHDDDRRPRRPAAAARSASELGVERHVPQDAASACTSASPARPCPIRTSAARARPAPAACVRALHGRLPTRREEHARPELPLVRREARRRR